MPNKILFCVLNWGLGHASRSIPIINNMLEEGSMVTIASDGGALELLKKEFPNLHFVDLPPYDINYKYQSISLNLLNQSFKILRAIKKENKEVGKLVNRFKFDKIVSDNRFGCYHQDCTNIFITHQLRLLHKTPFIQAAATRLNLSFIHKFHECWVPDFEGDQSLSGDLHQNVDLQIPVHYIGPQSRFEVIPTPVDPTIEVLAILSGPEPQRSFLQEILESQLKEVTGKHVIITGKAIDKSEKDNIQYLGITGVEGLSDWVSKAKHIISRSGYSSLMDYHAMQRKAILIPTPGQSEQEYLAKKQLHLDHHIVLSQDKIDLPKILKQKRV